MGMQHAVQQRLGEAGDRGERRRQLVRDVGHEVAAHLLLALKLVDVMLQRGGHLVEGRRQPPVLVGRADIHPCRVVAVGHARGGGGQPRQRTGQPPREQHRDDNGKDNRAQRRDQQDARHRRLEDREGRCAYPWRRRERDGPDHVTLRRAVGVDRLDGVDTLREGRKNGVAE